MSIYLHIGYNNGFDNIGWKSSILNFSLFVCLFFFCRYSRNMYKFIKSIVFSCNWWIIMFFFFFFELLLHLQLHATRDEKKLTASKIFNFLILFRFSNLEMLVVYPHKSFKCHSRRSHTVVGLLSLEQFIFWIRISQTMSYAVVLFIGKLPSLWIQAGIAAFGGDT